MKNSFLNSSNILKNLFSYLVLATLVRRSVKKAATLIDCLDRSRGTHLSRRLAWIKAENKLPKTPTSWPRCGRRSSASECGEQASEWVTSLPGENSKSQRKILSAKWATLIYVAFHLSFLSFLVFLFILPSRCFSHSPVDTWLINLFLAFWGWGWDSCGFRRPQSRPILGHMSNGFVAHSWGKVCD